MPWKSTRHSINTDSSRWQYPTVLWSWSYYDIKHWSLTHHAVSASRGFNVFTPSAAIIRCAIITLITTVISSAVFHWSLILISIAHRANFIRGSQETAPGCTKTRPMSHLKGLCSCSSRCHNVAGNLENQFLSWYPPWGVLGHFTMNVSSGKVDIIYHTELI